MASSSDTPQAARGYIPPQNEEERLLMRRVEEICTLAEARGIPRHTGFLSDREQQLAEAAMHRAGCTCARFWGGYGNAERRLLLAEPPGAWQEDPIALLRMQAAGEALPGHRDYLGAVLGLGLDRACLGDLLPDPQNPAVFYAFVLEDKAALIEAELTGAGRCPVAVIRQDVLPPAILQGPEREMQEATVSSLRADAVLAAMLHTSRTRAAEYIAAGRVEINHLPARGAYEPMYAQDIVTIRGQGRYRLAAIGGKSRKDRIFISFYKY